MNAIAKKSKPAKLIIVRCPVCHRDHTPHREFGEFCCASCLQTVIRPLIVAMTHRQ